MMKRLLFTVLLLLSSITIALAQCNGIFPNNTVCGNASGASNTPRPTSPAGFQGSAGGTNGQIQYNKSGALGGFTAGQDCTITPSTGAVICTKTNGTAFAPSATTDTTNAANITSGILTTTHGGTGASNNINATNDVLASNGTNGNFVHTALLTLINTLCGLSPTTCANIFGYGNVVWWGAVCNGTTDDRLAIIAAIAATPSGGVLQFPASSCAVKSLTTAASIFVISNPIHISFSNGGGILKTTVIGWLFDIQSSNVTIDGSSAAVIDGGWTVTTYSQGDGAIVINSGGGFTTSRSNIKVNGIQITNWADYGIIYAYCIYCDITKVTINNIAYAGIWFNVQHGQATDNKITNIWGSTGPDQPGNPVYRANHYGIAVSYFNSPTFLPEYDVIANNIIDYVPAWECYDSHAGQNIIFSNNVANNCNMGFAINSPSGTVATDITITNNQVQCIPLGSPVYNGSAGLSVGGPGVTAVGQSVGSPSGRLVIIGNIENGCGPDNLSIEGNVGALYVSLWVGVIVNNNLIYNPRYSGILIGDNVVGQVQNNNIINLTQGPVGSAFGVLFTGSTSLTNILLGGVYLSGTSINDGIEIASTNTVAISRDNVMSGYTTRIVGTFTDLGATTP